MQKVSCVWLAATKHIAAKAAYHVKTENMIAIVLNADVLIAKKQKNKE